MNTYVALLRGINVGGNKMVAMADLRAALVDMGFADVKTVLQSGNVVLRGRVKTPAALEALLETEIGRRLGVSADFHVRTAGEWRGVIDANPFRDAAVKDPSHLLVTFFKAPLDPRKVTALQGAITGREAVRCDGRHLYMTFPDGIGDSKATVLAGKMLGAWGTSRNWNTVMKLAALACP
jgi:uncharacterized protein (DUF1697 family)